MKGALVGSIFESLLDSVFMDTSTPAVDPAALAAAQQAAAAQAAQALAEQQAREAEAKAAYDRMMQTYKRLEGSGAAYGRWGPPPRSSRWTGPPRPRRRGAEPLRYRRQDRSRPDPPLPAGPTPFFGDAMPVDQLRTLVNPETNPTVVDLRHASAYVAEQLKKTPP